MGTSASKELYNREVERTEQKLGRSLDKAEKAKIQKRVERYQEISLWEKHIDKAIEFEAHCYMVRDPELSGSRALLSNIQEKYASKGYNVEIRHIDGEVSPAARSEFCGGSYSL